MVKNDVGLSGREELGFATLRFFFGVLRCLKRENLSTKLVESSLMMQVTWREIDQGII
jgi:hypothetical protein